LGLSTVIGIVKGHGGFLHVYSQPGKGSTFAAYLPENLGATESKAVTMQATEFRGRGELILFVDDEPALRQVARNVLGRLNFKALTAHDGADGMIQVTQHRTELRAVITDLHMPILDGLGFVRSLRRMLPDIPILVTSGRLDDSFLSETKTLGLINRLDKPFTEDQLARALENILAPK
jgi:CheY-like chemotaxis protein